MKVYRCKICGSTKSRKNGYFRVPDYGRKRSSTQLEDPRKLRIMLHIAAPHLQEGDSVPQNDIEIIEL